MKRVHFLVPPPVIVKARLFGLVTVFGICFGGSVLVADHKLHSPWVKALSRTALRSCQSYFRAILIKSWAGSTPRTIGLYFLAGYRDLGGAIESDWPTGISIGIMTFGGARGRYTRSLPDLVTLTQAGKAARWQPGSDEELSFGTWRVNGFIERLACLPLSGL